MVSFYITLSDHTTERIEFSLLLPGEDSFQFGLCKTGGGIFCSDLEIHCIYELDIPNGDV